MDGEMYSYDKISGDVFQYDFLMWDILRDNGI